MTFSEHLDELRRRLIVCVVTVVLLMLVAFAFHHQLEVFVTLPFEWARKSLAEDGHEIGTLKTLSPTEPVMFAFKLSFYAALVVGMPICLYQMWLFIGAGLYSKEKRAVLRVLPASILLFFTGASFAFFVLIPVTLKFLLTFGNPEIIQPEIRLSEYQFFFTTFVVMLGLVFQLPLLQIVLAKFNLMSPRFMAEKRRLFVMGAFVLAAVATPSTDPWSMMLVAAPVLVLFEIGLVLSRRVTPLAPRPQEA
jgi:sec-independent protein translocase protein TatC